MANNVSPDFKHEFTFSSLIFDMRQSSKQYLWSMDELVGAQ